MCITLVYSIYLLEEDWMTFTLAELSTGLALLVPVLNYFNHLLYTG